VRIPNCSEAPTSGPIDCASAPVAAAQMNKADANPFILNLNECEEENERRFEDDEM